MRLHRAKQKAPRARYGGRGARQPQGPALARAREGRRCAGLGMGKGRRWECWAAAFLQSRGADLNRRRCLYHHGMPSQCLPMPPTIKGASQYRGVKLGVKYIYVY